MKMDKRFKYKILLGLEVLVLACALFQYVIPLHCYNYKGSDVTGSCCRYQTYSEGYGMGCYLDETLICGDVDEPTLLYMTTPYMDLPRGSYQVWVTYSTDDQDQKYAVTSRHRTYPVITGNDGNRIPAGNHTLQFSFFSPIRVEEFQVHMNYSGSGYLFVESIAVHETNAWKNIVLFYVLLVMAAVNGIMFWHWKLSSEHRGEARCLLLVIGCLTVYASVPLFTFFMPHGVDLLFHMNRIEAVKEAVLAGQFPNRVSPYWNDGYGYASSVFYGELFLYVPALLRIVGFSVQGAYKFYVVLINLLTAGIAYYCFQKAFRNNRASLVGTVAYMLAPVRLTAIYLRGAVGEYTAMAFFPLVFYGMFRICEGDPEKEDYRKSYLPLLLGMTGLLQSHLISVIIAAGFAGLFCLVYIRKIVRPVRMGQMVRAVGGTVLLNLWFLLPFADYFCMGYTSTDNEFTKSGRMNAYGASLNEMVTLFQDGMGGAYTIPETSNYADERNYALGGFLLVAFLYMAFRTYQGKQKTTLTRVGDGSFIFAVVGTFMCTIWFPWDWIQQMNGLFRRITGDIQFPSRFLGIACFFFAVVTVCLVIQMQLTCNRPMYYAAVAVVCCVFLISADSFMHSYTENATLLRNVDSGTLDTGNLGAGEYLPIDTPKDFLKNSEILVGDGLEVTDQKYGKGTHTVSCRNQNDEAVRMDFPLIPYKGYVCRDGETGKKLPVLLDVPGKTGVMVPAGYTGTFTVRFEEPWYWRAAEAVSLLTFFGGMAGEIARRRRGSVHVKEKRI